MSWLESVRDEISQQMDCWNQPIEKGVEGYLVVPALSFPHHLDLMKDLTWPSMRLCQCSLAELSEMLYTLADRRTPRFILHLHNVTFGHVIAIQEIFYYHRVPDTNTTLWHTLPQHKLPRPSDITFNFSSVHTEEEERHFSAVNSISKTTSNGYPEQIILIV